jgi:hypothetical protein
VDGAIGVEIIEGSSSSESRASEESKNSSESVESDATYSLNCLTPASPCVETTGSEGERAGDSEGIGERAVGTIAGDSEGTVTAGDSEGTLPAEGTPAADEEDKEKSEGIDALGTAPEEAPAPSEAEVRVLKSTPGKRLSLNTTSADSTTRPSLVKTR